MPTAVGPNTKGEENLVFGYDLGDTVNSHRGEPATNLITSGIPGYFGSGGQTLYQNKLYGLKSDSGVFQRNYVTNPALADSGTYNNNGGLYKTFATSNLNASTRYIRICFDFYMITRYRTYSDSGRGLNGYIGITNADSTTDAYGWNTTYCNGSGDDWSNDEAYVGKWQKVTLIAELRGDKNPASINAMYIYYDRFTQGEGIFTNFIITEHAAFPTGPVRYTAGTRSATQGLIDLTGNSTIDLTNVSFDSNAQMTFDGSNDYISLGDNSLFDFINGIGSVEAIVKFPSSWTAGSQYPNLISKGASAGWDTDGWSLFGFRSYGSGTGYTLGIGIRNTGTVNIALTYDQPADTWLHVVGTLDGSSIKIYINGALVTTNSQTVNPGDNNTNVYIGRDPNSQYFPGDIPYVKVYSRALTAQEIRSNFNAIKGRFGI